jgi:hypothetical protein
MDIGEFILLGSGEIGSVVNIDWKNILLLLLLASFFTAYPMLESVKFDEIYFSFYIGTYSKSGACLRNYISLFYLW